MSNLKEQIKAISWWHRINIPGYGYTPGEVNHGPDGGDWPTTRFGLPEDLSGKSVLDIGCWDGFFSFEAEKRGAANVIASDCSFFDIQGDPAPSVGFLHARRMLDSRVGWVNLDIQDYSPMNRFSSDLVLCYGVLYHIKNPLLAIENLFQLTNNDGTCLIETAISNINIVPMLEYKPNFENDPTNFFYPNILWMELASKQAGFKSFEVLYNDTVRATFKLTK